MDKSLLYGGLSGVVESCFSHPIDFYKVKYQESVFNGQPRKHMIPFMVNQIKTNGFLSLYTGFVPKIVSIIPVRTTFWGIQDICNKNLQIEDKMAKYTVSGLVAGFFQTVVETPAEVAKIKLMNGQTSTVKNAFNGFRWNAIRNSVFCSAVCLSNNYYQEDDKLLKFLVNGSSAFMISVATQPFDFMKTKYQINDHTYKLSFFDAIRWYKLKMFSGTFSRAYTGAINMGIGALVFNYLMSI
jgi:hypothetical protein